MSIPMPKLKLLVKKLIVEVHELKNCPLQRPNSEVCN